MDVPYLRRWSFGVLEQTANRSFGRVGVVHLALIFGIFVSTILTLVVIPLLYYVLRRKAADAGQA